MFNFVETKQVNDMATIKLSEVKQGDVFQFIGNDKQTFVVDQVSPARFYVQCHNARGKGNIIEKGYNHKAFNKEVITL